MGNTLSEERRLKERERNLQLRAVNLEASRFGKLKRYLYQMQNDKQIDDVSDEAWNLRMNHYFQNSKKFYTSNKLKSCVSQKKRRFQNDFFDLDLAYITKRVIAMGYPSTGLESIYRNSREEVISFLTSYYPTHYKIYNLCQEINRYYTFATFPSDMVAYFPMKDHNPTDLTTMLEFCIDVYLYLAQHPDNVVAVHCKAGKGRTGLMICAYLLFLEAFPTPTEAIDFYGRRRTHNGKGLTIPSQIRYVHYFNKFLKDCFVDNYYNKVPSIVKTANTLKRVKALIARKIQIVGINIGPVKKVLDAKITISRLDDSVVWSGNIEPTTFNLDSLQYSFPDDIVGDQDYNFQFESKKLKFSCWVNTYFFIPKENLSRSTPRYEKDKPEIGAELCPKELDKFKGKFSDDFSIIIMGIDLIEPKTN
ncbi:unnamed protein product [Blepharisma stoltei]|uniref:Phosphatidylinositol-3,4,5-trisphosphate 3-phosphatase n=1 Tax=Blepharisma stoltei TaxID=1481888 RepID=A0AAU9K1M2_9CILI|nr:unnamed protein product [Blepharisma stoltei]